MSKFSIEQLESIAMRANDDIMILIDQHGWPALAPANFLEEMGYNGAIEYLERAASVLRSRALELRHPADGGNSPLPEDGASNPDGPCCENPYQASKEDIPWCSNCGKLYRPVSTDKPEGA